MRHAGGVRTETPEACVPKKRAAHLRAAFLLLSSLLLLLLADY
jgi:hypothetical protein